MGKFADQLLIDLIEEHRPILQSIQRPETPARRTVSRPVWVTAGTAVGALGAIAAGAVMFGGSPAYAVTQNANGTVNLSISNSSGIAGANLKLHALGLRVVVVPVGSGCESISSLPKPAVLPGRVSGRASGNSDSITIDVKGIPLGDIDVVAAEKTASGRITLAEALSSGPAPKCVSLNGLPSLPGSGSSGVTSGSRSGSGSTSGSGEGSAIPMP